MNIQLNKKSINKDLYPKVIDTSFKQLLIQNEESSTTDISVEEFFKYYDELFFDIPLDGNINSHVYLIKKSTEYVGETQNTEEIDLLLNEINQLRLQLLEARQTIDELTQ